MSVFLRPGNSDRETEEKQTTFLSDWTEPDQSKANSKPEDPQLSDDLDRVRSHPVGSVRMEKAGTVIRRSGVRLRTSLGGSSHADLQMAIGQLKDARATHRAFLQSEAAAWQDLTKWALRECEEVGGRAIQDTLVQIGDLAALWAEAQRESNEALREFRRSFEMVLEGERGVDAARAALCAAEAREARAKKDLKKAARRKAAQAELAELTGKLEAAERERQMAQLEVADRVREHGVIRTVRVREGLLKLAQAQMDSAQKCETLFGAAHFVAEQMPDVSDAHDVADVKYTGSGAAMRAVQTAKDRVNGFRRVRRSLGAAAAVDPLDPPPPYSEEVPTTHCHLSSPPSTASFHVSSCSSSFSAHPSASASASAATTPRRNSSLPFGAACLSTSSSSSVKSPPSSDLATFERERSRSPEEARFLFGPTPPLHDHSRVPPRSPPLGADGESSADGEELARLEGCIKDLDLHKR